MAPSPESIIRQVLYGNEFSRKEFGIESCDYILPDCFGFSYTMPTILAHCGLKGFSTQKLIWNCAQGIPFGFGIWQGPDGSEIMAALNPGHYNSSISGMPDMDNTWAKRIEENGTRYGMFADFHYYGIGDRGGAVSESDANRYIAASKRNDGKYRIYQASSGRIFSDVNEAVQKRFPRYKGEFLLVEHSAGSLTSASFMKRCNRKNEQLADAAERAAVIADWLGSSQYPLEKLGLGWSFVLGSQMHDILPGTCVPSAYDYSENDEIVGLNIFSCVLESSVGAVIAGMDTTARGKSLAVYNPLSIARKEVVQASLTYDCGAPQFVSVLNARGSEIPSQISAVDGNTITVLFLADVPPVGIAVYDVRPAKKASDFNTGLRIGNSEIENADLRVRIDPNGDIAALYDKKARREVLEKPARLAFLKENPAEWPAWNMDWKDRRNDPIDYVSGPAKVTIVEKGPVRVSLKIERQARNSFFTQFIRLGCGDRSNVLEVKNQVDWQSAGVSLKAVFPLTVSNPLATYTTGLGTIQRGNNEPRKYEVPSHEWFDLTDRNGSYGVSILEDCKYGSDKPSDNVLRLTLLYTPASTNEDYLDQKTQDWGRHEFIYCIYPHNASWQDDSSYWQGRRLNQPMKTFLTASHTGNAGPNFSMLTCSTGQADIMAFKKAQSGNKYIVRLQETSSMPLTDAVISAAAKIISAAEVDGQEKEIGPAVLKDGKLVFSMKPNAIRSFALEFKTPRSKLVPPLCQAVKLDYNCDVISSDSNRADGRFGQSEKTIPAELFPAMLCCDGINFELGSAADGTNNALACRGQEIELPKGNFNRVYILAAADKDTAGLFKAGDNIAMLKIQAWTGFVGQFDKRIWPAKFAPADYKGQSTPVRLETGFIKRDKIAWLGTHRHNPSGNDAYQFSYIFKYSLDLKGKNRLMLPDNPQIKVFAITVADNANDNVAPAMPLYDDFGGRGPVELRKH
jgi:alpha-mannosidase